SGSVSNSFRSACGAGDQPPWSPPKPISTVSMPSSAAVSSASARVMVDRLSVSSPISMSASCGVDRGAVGCGRGEAEDAAAADEGGRRYRLLVAEVPQADDAGGVQRTVGGQRDADGAA